MGHYIPLYKSMELEIEGREMELLAFIASLESKKKMGNSAYDKLDGEEVVRGEEDILG